GKEQQFGIVVRFDLRLGAGDARRKTFDSQLNLTVEIVAPKREHFERDRFAPAQKRGPQQRFFGVFVDRGRRLREGDEAEVRRLLSQGESIDKARIAFVAVEQITDADAIEAI